uniref:Laminin G domain-containing protein n=1 Tax=Stomoxys calcitrans TaxID=35570 RepID=A0A1I8Q7N5_STOCA
MLWFLLLLLIARKAHSIELTGQAIKDAMAEFDLLAMINENLNGIEFDYAEDGFPAYKILQIADIKSPYRMILPERLNAFAVQTTFMPTSAKGGYLFSVVDPLDTVVQFGLHFSPVIKDTWNVSLLYTDTTTSSISKRLATYQLPYEPKKWVTVALKVMSDKVIYYYNCEEKETTLVKRDPQELVFASSSTLYLAQAGPKLGGNMEPSLRDKPSGEQPPYEVSGSRSKFDLRQAQTNGGGYGRKKGT